MYNTYVYESLKQNTTQPLKIEVTVKKYHRIILLGSAYYRFYKKSTKIVR